MMSQMPGVESRPNQIEKKQQGRTAMGKADRSAQRQQRQRTWLTRRMAGGPSLPRTVPLNHMRML
jgi:hypothetical protein